jgi:hypothetical protein
MLPRPFSAWRELIACLLLGLPMAVARAQSVASAWVYFYTEPGFQGEVFALGAGNTLENLALVRDSRGLPFNDRVRSVQLAGPVRVLAFQNAGFGGASIWLNGDVPDLGAFSIDATARGSWDRNISALQVQPVAANIVGFVRWDRREAERVVRAAYRDILGRDADGPGLRLYLSRLIEGGWSEDQLRDSLRHSDEFRHRDLDAIIRRVFRDVLGREPDASGLATYQRSLGRGMTEAEMRGDLARSREGAERQITLAITRAYREILRREPDAGGLENYTRLMRQKGWTESDVRHDLRRSAEAGTVRGG